MNDGLKIRPVSVRVRLGARSLDYARAVRDDLAAAFLTASTQDTWLIARAHKFVVEMTGAGACASWRYILTTVPGEHGDRILQLFR
jgi:hypothetical protein